MTITAAKNIIAPSTSVATKPLSPTATYTEAYAVLSEIAERLRATGATANIDRLAADLQKARAAHAVCRERLAAIRTEIDREIEAVEIDMAPRGSSLPLEGVSAEQRDAA